MRYSSNEFLTSKSIVHNWFINLGNPFEIIVYWLLIGMMTNLGHRGGVPMVSALLCMVT